MKVYVVTFAECDSASDVLGVFSTLELAEQCVVEHTTPRLRRTALAGFDIDECEIDAPVGAPVNV